MTASKERTDEEVIDSVWAGVWGGVHRGALLELRFGGAVAVPRQNTGQHVPMSKECRASWELYVTQQAGNQGLCRDEQSQSRRFCGSHYVPCKRVSALSGEHESHLKGRDKVKTDFWKDC